jgi:serine/threonine-protein kinase
VDIASILDLDLFALADRVLDTYPDPVPFDDFGPYRILESIGKGGMGEVFLAQDEASGRRVAVKFLRDYWAEPDLRSRFSREVKTHARLEHPFIARLYEAGIHPCGTPYFAMEYVEGKPLDEYCRTRQCSFEERTRLFRSICEAVQYAHGRAVIHLDLKPSNILVKEDGTPKLLDFGIARHLERFDEPVKQTQTFVRFTPAYAAPEQIRREAVGTHTDVYTLGVVLYELIAQKAPYDFTECTPAEAEAMIARTQEEEKPSAAASRIAIKKSARKDLDILCLTAMKKDAARRYGSVLELMQDIDRYLGNEPLKARPDTLGYRASKFIHRNGRALFVSAAMLLLAVGLTGFYTVRLANARDAALTQTARAMRIQRFMLSMFAGVEDSAPSEDLRVTTILERGVQQMRMLKTEPVDQAALYQTLASIYQQLGQLDRADSLFQAGLKISRSNSGPDSQEVADSLVGLGMLRIDQAKFADAERLIREALAIYKRKLPAGNPAAARALTALGSVLEHRGDYAGAVQILQQAVQLQSRPPVETADLVESLTYLSNSQHLLGQNAAAYPMARRVLDLDRQSYGERHPRIAEDLSNVGQILEDLGKYAKAEQDERRALDIVRAWYGKDHIETALLSEALAKTLVQEHKYAEAEALLRPALSIQERHLGKNHPFVALALNFLGVIALKRGNLDDAESDFRRMKQIYESLYGENNSHTAAALSRFGELCLARKQYLQAERFFRQSVQGFTKTLSAGNVKTAIARIELGGVLVHEQRYREAEEELLAGYRIVTNENTFSPETAMDARRNLVAVYEALHMPDKVAGLRAQFSVSH